MVGAALDHDGARLEQPLAVVEHWIDFAREHDAVADRLGPVLCGGFAVSIVAPPAPRDAMAAGFRDVDVADPGRCRRDLAGRIVISGQSSAHPKT